MPETATEGCETTAYGIGAGWMRGKGLTRGQGPESWAGHALPSHAHPRSCQSYGIARCVGCGPASVLPRPAGQTCDGAATSCSFSILQIVFAVAVRGKCPQDGVYSGGEGQEEEGRGSRTRTLHFRIPPCSQSPTTSSALRRQSLAFTDHGVVSHDSGSPLTACEVFVAQRC